ncbi:putative Lactase-phlorizin hydrolase [Daphnia magna]|uniref:beta-glucosidase n=1 Tax=Daphnia magna TaxID=35525 RepID=A0A162DCW3_9CRUS|nr:putative Lactase-phlorizin hydrolase [Daphnia magna]
MPACKCVSEGGTCCGTDPSVRDHVNDDPRTMDPNDRCYTCYNSDVSVTCKGKLIRSQPISETERFVTSEKCKQVGGTCCMKSPTYAFNPNYISDNCNDCYSGQVALPCGGNLLASSNYTAKTCATFGGRCCDRYPTGGDAFNAIAFPDPELLRCTYCYSGTGIDWSSQSLHFHKHSNHFAGSHPRFRKRHKRSLEFEMNWTSLLLLALSTLAVSIYVDEPLLYDTFPPDFMWATATSAYQIEGGWDADGKGLSIYDVWMNDSNHVTDGTSGKVACNSYYFYEKDIEALRSLGVSYYRFSISWARVLPDGIGRINQPGIDYYKRLIAALKAANIQPMVKYWITINEPWVIAYQGYGSGNTAPGTYGPGTFTYQAGHHIILAHAKAYRAYETQFKPTQQGKVGITVNINWYDPKDDQLENIEAAERALQFLGGWIANPIYGSGDYPDVMKQKVGDKSAQQGFNQSRLPEFTAEQKILVRGSADFFGLNYYTSYLTANKIQDISIIDYGYDQDIESYSDPTCYQSSFDWLTITPFGMRKTLQWIKDRFNDPEIIITENGISDRAGNLDDMMRVYYYKHNINSMLKAIKDGVRVTGYAAWSLMDNFEWGNGFTQKFGLFSIDFTTSDLNRTTKASARYYAKLVNDNGFMADQPCNNSPI